MARDPIAVAHDAHRIHGHRDQGATARVGLVSMKRLLDRVRDLLCGSEPPVIHRPAIQLERLISAFDAIHVIRAVVRRAEGNAGIIRIRWHPVEDAVPHQRVNARVKLRRSEKPSRSLMVSMSSVASAR